MEQILLPRKVIKAKNVENVKALKIKRPLQSALRGDAEWLNSLVKVDGEATLILDFGKEMHGGIRIITSRGSKVEDLVRVRFGESLSEACSELGERGSCNDHAARDFPVKLMPLSDVTFGQSGFRFVRIDFPKTTKIYIQNIYCVNRILSKKAQYVYKGKDKRIKEIFTAAKRTVDLCASSGLVWDGVKRDRLVWIGDMHPEMLALTTLYGRMKEIENSLDFVKEQTILPAWMNGYPTYSMWWMIIICDYYKFNKCKDYALKQIDYMKGLIKQVDDFSDEQGNTKYPFNFVDWPSSGAKEAYDGTRAITIIAIKRAIEFLSEFGEDVTLAKKVLDKLLRLPINGGNMKQIIALKYLALGQISDEEYGKLIAGGAKGLSTFMSYYILTAIASRDEAKAIEIMKEYYGAMLDVGATTFWEDFDIEWTKNCSKINKLPRGNQTDIHGDFGAHCYVGFRHSFCHGWSSGVIKFIQEHC